MDYQKTGLIISNLRKENKLTQKELADKLGITDRAVSKWERGLGCPDVSLLDDLSRILNISILEILKGRRLDKDEIVKNENIIESMNYSKESYKHKMKKYFNHMCILIIILISLVLVFSNIKSIYYLNKTYHDNFYDNSSNELVTKINNEIEIIKNNKGIYDDNEYKKILTFINKLQSNLKKQNNLYYLTKMNYTYYDIVKFYDCHQEFSYLEAPMGHIQETYEIMHKHNPNVIYDIVFYYQYTYILSDSDSKLFDQLGSPYYNNGKTSDYIVTLVKSFIINEINRDIKLLDDIIKVGEISE